jgi:cytochrome c biogenesis protein CcmG/thiol:disulfide interchange protein DsbE
MRRHYLSCVFGVLILFSVLSSPFQSVAATSDWTLKDLDEGRFTLSENLGKGPTVLIFWATWCRPCRQEMKEYKAVFESYQEKGVQVLVISEDNSKTQSQVKPFMKSNDYKFTTLLDPTGEVLKSYGGVSIPYTVVLDSSAKIQKTYRGKIRDISELSSLLEKLLAETPGE